MNETTPDSELVGEILAELEEGIREENEGGKAGWLECFSPSVRMRTINGMMLQFLQQLNGQNFYYYYGDTFWKRYFFVPEVKGLSLEQVDELSRSGVKPWNSASWQPKHGTTRKAAFQRTYYASEQRAMDRADVDRIEAAKENVADAEKRSEEQEEAVAEKPKTA
ncbi:hypothetical protein P7C70_g705, partial [Phenoliferia sp. Uapishka_3]